MGTHLCNAIKEFFVSIHFLKHINFTFIASILKKIEHPGLIILNQSICATYCINFSQNYWPHVFWFFFPHLFLHTKWLCAKPSKFRFYCQSSWSYRYTKTSKTHGFLLKLYFSKAYDHVDHNFLLQHKILTLDNLSKRCMYFPNRYFLFAKKVKLVSHIFIDLLYAWNTWMKILMVWNLCWIRPKNLMDMCRL